MSLKLRIRFSVLALLLLLLGLGCYAFLSIEYLQRGAHGIEQADFESARQTVLAFMLTGTVLGLLLATVPAYRELLSADAELREAVSA